MTASIKLPRECDKSGRCLAFQASTMDTDRVVFDYIANYKRNLVKGVDWPTVLATNSIFAVTTITHVSCRVNSAN